MNALTNLGLGLEEEEVDLVDERVHVGPDLPAAPRAIDAANLAVPACTLI